MELQDELHVDRRLLEQIISNITNNTEAQNACVLLFNESQGQYECIYGSNCNRQSSKYEQVCTLPLKTLSPSLLQLIEGKCSKDHMPTNNLLFRSFDAEAQNQLKQVAFPFAHTTNVYPGLFIIEHKKTKKIKPEETKIVKAAAAFCSLALHKSETLVTSVRMITKLNLLSDASNVLLSEFENKGLPEKLDYVVQKTLEILDAELCTLWLVDGEELILETSFSETGKVEPLEIKKSPITETPEFGLTGHIASQKKPFNSYGIELRNLRNQAKSKPVNWVNSLETHSELAYPILDEHNDLLGVLFAYNKKDALGNPLKESGFTEDFDEPLMKILTSKIAISIKNAEQLKKLRDYKLIVESTPDPVVISNRAGEIIYMNPGAVNIFGNLIGCPVAGFYPSDERVTGIEKARETKRQVLERKDKRLKNFETAFMSKDGEVIPISLSLSLLYDEHGEETGTIGIAKDLREIRALVSAGQNLIASKNQVITRLRAFERVQQSTTGKDLKIDRIYETLMEAVVDILGYKYATISAVDKEKQKIGPIKAQNVEQEYLSSVWHSLDSKDIQAWVVRHEEHVYLAGWDERLDKDIFEKHGHDKLVRVIIPILARGEVIGTLETGYDKSFKSQITDEEIAILQKLVNLAAVGIEQTKLLHRLKDDIALRNDLEKQLDALNQASIQILNSTTEEEVINHIFRSLERIGYTKGMLSLINEDSGKIEGKHAFGGNWRQIPLSESLYTLKGKNILAQAIHSKIPILCKNCTKDPRWNRKLARELQIKSQYVIPMTVKNKPIGTLQIDLSDWQDLVYGEEAVLERRMKVLETFASQSAIAIRNIRDMVTIDRLEENIAETAHEFRSPMHNIMTQLGGLKDSLEHNKDEKEIDRFVNIIEEQIYRANRQVNNSLLANERIRKTMAFDFQDGHIQDVIKDCVDAYKLRAMERGINIIIRDKVKKLPKFRFDRVKMEQAVTNIIDNAVKYSHYNQSIDIIGFDDGTKINIEISDRGMGIPLNEFNAIFKGFTRSEVKDKIRYIPGTGLGLKICKEIIEHHGGEINVSSVPITQNPQKIKEFQDYKTTFKVTLPKYRRERKVNDQSPFRRR